MPFFKLTLKEQIGEREWWYTYLIQAECEKIAQEKAKDYAQNFYGDTEDDEDVPEINEESNTLDFGEIFLTWSLERTKKGKFIKELLKRYTYPENGI